MTNCLILDKTKTVFVPVTILSWNESQECVPSIRDIPKNSSGQYVDSGMYVVKCKKVDMTCRFTDMDKNAFNSIFGFSEMVYVHLLPESGITGWEYYGWVNQKNVKWQYAKTNYEDNSGDNERCWLASLTFDIESYTYYSDFENETVG